MKTFLKALLEWITIVLIGGTAIWAIVDWMLFDPNKTAIIIVAAIEALVLVPIWYILLTKRSRV